MGAGSSWTPPDWVFPVVWTTLYVLIAWAGWRVGLRAPLGEAALPLGLWACQIALNVLWTPVFFGLRRPDLAVVGLTGSPRLVALADALSDEVKLGLAKVDRIRRNAGEQVASHRSLLELLEDGDVEQAARELEQHLAHAEDSMLTALRLPAGG